jgi:hypothetical protein
MLQFLSPSPSSSFHHCHTVSSRMNHYTIPLLNNCCYNHLNEDIFTFIMRTNWFPEFLIGKIFRICQMKIFKILASKLNWLCFKVDLLVVNKVIITQRRFRIKERKLWNQRWKAKDSHQPKHSKSRVSSRTSERNGTVTSFGGIFT